MITVDMIMVQRLIEVTVLNSLSSILDKVHYKFVRVVKISITIVLICNLTNHIRQAFQILYHNHKQCHN